MSERYRIDNSEISVRLMNCLLGEGLTYWDEAAKLTDKEISWIPNFGQKSLAELRNVLANPEKYQIPPRPPVIPPHIFPLPGSSEHTLKRNIDIAKRRRNGETYKAIGDRHGLSKDRVSQILSRQLRRNTPGAPPPARVAS